MAEQLRRTANPRGAGARLREELLGAAVRLLDAAQPEARLTLRGVAREAGVAAPSIYDHFPRLDDLRNAVDTRCADDLLAALARTGDRAVRLDPAGRLRTVARSYVRWGLDHPARYAAALQGPAARPVVDLFTALLSQDGSSPPRRGARAARLRSGAVFLWAGLHGITGLRTADPDFGWPSLDRALDALLAGLPPDPTAG
jgi:AcrR family transcriptional regulator